MSVDPSGPRSPYVITHRGSHRFDVSPAELWAALERVDRFETWWGWLHELRADGGLVTGATLHGVVTPPLTYRMQVTVRLLDCVAPQRIDAEVTGDLRGPATLRITAADAGCTVETRWQVEMMQPPMRLAARVARPLMQWGHDRVIDLTVSSFRRQLHR